MRRLGHRLQLGVFLAAVCVPCIALIALSLRIISQDRELAGKRQADERRREVLQIRDALLARLNPIRNNEIRRDLEPGEHYRYPEVVFVARIEDGALVLPWEADRAARRCRDLIAKPYFEARIRQCEQSDFGAGRDGSAARCYEEALGAARHPVQAAYARWLWAQALDKAGENRRAAELFRLLLDAPPDITDEEGVPLALYAARRLAPSAADRGRVLKRAKEACSSRPWLPPIAWLPVSEIPFDELQKLATAQMRMTGQAERLRDDFARLGLIRKDRKPEPAWVPYGDDGWLVGAAQGAAIVVRGRELLPSVRFADYREAQGESLGAAFPGLKVVLAQTGAPAKPPGGDLRRGLYYTMLFLIVAVTTFAGYLLWRDLKREMRVAELRSQFVASISHELKTPLTAIRMFAETLQLRRAKDAETEEEYLETIVNECERLSRLVDGVLLFSKAEQGKKIYHFRPVQPADTVQAAVRALHYPLSQQGFELRMEIDGDLPVISADRDAIEQATLNLLTNAMKYSGDSRAIELGLGRENGDVVIRVTDHGLGIAVEEQARIFEKFYRVPTRENQAIPGAGLGLALVAQIARAHGGRTEVKSAPGQGSTFTIRLPIAAPKGDHP
jgi:signal transduction histidine kinase